MTLGYHPQLEQGIIPMKINRHNDLRRESSPQSSPKRVVPFTLAWG